MRMEASLIILTGGESRRMGREKGLMSVGGKPLIRSITEELRPLFSETIIVSRHGQYGNWNDYADRVVSDPEPYRGKGPLAGLLAGIQSSTSPRLFLTAGDMPFVSSDLASYLMSRLHSPYQAVIPSVKSRIHPLFAAYHADCARDVELLLQQESYRMMDLFSRIPHKILSSEEWEELVDPVVGLMNMNSPGDWQDAERLAQQFSKKHKKK